MNTVVKKPILGSMKHANVPPSFSPEPNLNKALDSIEQTLNTFLNSVNAWREKSGEVQASYGNYTHASQIKLGRSQKTGKMVFSESRGQMRTGHDYIDSSLLKPRTIETFLAFETALLSLPALSHQQFRIGFRNWRTDHFMFSLQDITLNPYSDGPSIMSRLKVAAEKLKNIAIKPNAPLWMVGTKVIPANCAQEAMMVYWVLDSIGHSEEKMEKKLKKFPNVLVGRLENMKDLEKQCKLMMTS